MTGKTYKNAGGLIWKNGSFWWRVTVPADLRTVFKKGVMMGRLDTSNEALARHGAKQEIERWKAAFAMARQGASPEAVQAQVDAWKLKQDRSAAASGDLTRLLTLAVSGSRFDGLDQIAGTIGVPDSEPVRLAIAKALIEVEQARIFKAGVVQAVEVADTATAKALTYEREAFGQTTTTAKAATITGTSLKSLFDLWLGQHPRPEKEIAKNRQMLRRLAEWLGGTADTVDVGAMTKVKAVEFYADLKRFPARRKASADLMTMKAIIEANEGAGGERKAPLSAETVAEWLGFYRSLFKEAVLHDIIGADPMVVVRHKVEKTDLKGEIWTPEEIKNFFNSPIFRGHDGGKYRDRAGTKVIKDSKYWLPLVALWSGMRLSEVAASPASAVKVIDGVDVLDLSGRAISHDAGPRVKTKASRRLVPIHDELIRLGFVEYAKQVAGHDHLFPDLNHETRHGPGHGFSKWFGERRDRVGDTTKTFHELRHTWKRAARDARLDPTYSDLLSGHTSGKMGDKYGAGLDVKLLKTDMDKISFPDFPL